MSSKLGHACGAALLLAALGLGAPGTVWAAPPSSACPEPAPVALSADPQWINRGVEVLFDPQHDYRIEQVTAHGLCERFRTVPGIPAFGVEPRGVWLRLRLPDRAWESTAWRLLVPFGATERFCVHWPLRPEGYQSECADIDQPLGSGARARQGWYFSVPARFDHTRSVLLYTQGERVVEARLGLGTADAFANYLYNRQTLLGAYCGLMLCLALFGLLMLAAQPERSCAYFSAYILAGLLYYAAQGNYLSSLGFAGRIPVRLEFPLGAVGALCMTLFFQSFLETRRYAPRLHRLALVLLAPFLALSVSIPLLPATLVVQLLQGVAGAWTLAMLVLMGVRWSQGCRAAAYGLLAFAVPMIGGLLKSLQHYGLLILAPQTVELVAFVGQFLASGLIAIALVGRMRRLARERDQAKDLALSSQQLALHRAHYDDITQLPNRAKFREYLQERLLQRTPGQRYALVTLGLDRFGLLNDALGHDIGDGVLGEIARRLQSSLGAETLLARIGADLFAWLATGPDDPAEIEALRRRCESLQESVAVPLRLGSGARLSASFGIALCPDHAGSAELLLQYSDAALHRAKLRDAGSLRLFDPTMYQSASDYLELSKALHRALERDELALHYQPIVSFKTGRLLGVESLVRWCRDDGQDVPPDQFVPLTQSGNLLRPFTEWGLRYYCRQLADWQARQIAVPYAAFNLSAQQLRLPGIEQLILDVLDETGAPAERVTLEVTEGSLLDNLEDTARLLGRLKQRGMAVAVDDFGVGYASPHYLRMLPVDILKLDGVFLRGVPQQEEANSVLDGLIVLGQSLQLKIVAECVETAAQVQYLTSRGVTGGQGYWFSRALPAAQLEAWLQARSARAAA